MKTSSGKSDVLSDQAKLAGDTTGIRAPARRRAIVSTSSCFGDGIGGRVRQLGINP